MDWDHCHGSSRIHSESVPMIRYTVRGHSVLYFWRGELGERENISLELSFNFHVVKLVPYKVMPRLSYTKLTSSICPFVSSTIGRPLHEALGHHGTCEGVCPGPEFFGHLV